MIDDKVPKLKDCPFCGQRAVFVTNFSDTGRRICVMCDVCGIHTRDYQESASHYKHEFEGYFLAANDWNRRKNCPECIKED